VTIHGREVKVRAWRYTVHGITGHSVPVFFLDAALEENSEWDQTLTDYLYGGDEHLRLCQEVILGLGGVSMLRALGYKKVTAYHMNEGHSALLVLALLEERLHESEEETITEDDMDAVRQGCVFTTHTPVPAGHDNFPMEMVRQILGAERTNFLISSKCCFPERLNMTYLALTFSRYINGVSLRHGGISQNMFPDYPIDSVSNGVHGLTWTAPPFRRLYDKYMPEWRDDNLYLRYAISIPLDKIISAHGEAKRELFEEIEKRADVTLNPNVMTLGFARRATPYKRADLLFTHTERLRSITNQVGPLQVICGGKAHPRDESGKELIQRIYRAAESLAEAVRVVYLEEHDMDLAKHLCSGVDLWLNTPQKPQEASGTSGMKAALNGVPSLSVLDGWWIEGHVEGVTGWSIGDSWRAESEASEEIASLYDKLESVILPMFYQRPYDYARIMRSAIAINGSFFNAQRMMFQYMRNAYATAEAI
jgi:starch phosphorylase